MAQQPAPPAGGFIQQLKYQQEGKEGNIFTSCQKIHNIMKSDELQEIKS